MKLWNPGSEPLCPRKPSTSKIARPYLAVGEGCTQVSRCFWVCALSSEPVANAFAQIWRSCRVEIAAPAAQPQDGFISVTSHSRLVAAGVPEIASLPGMGVGGQESLGLEAYPRG